MFIGTSVKHSYVLAIKITFLLNHISAAIRNYIVRLIWRGDLNWSDDEMHMLILYLELFKFGLLLVHEI